MKRLSKIETARSDKTAKLPNAYAKYYRAYPVDEGYREEVQDILDHYDLEYVGDAICIDEYADDFSDAGIDVGTIAQDENGNIKVYDISHGRVYDMLNEIDWLLKRNGVN